MCVGGGGDRVVYVGWGGGPGGWGRVGVGCVCLHASVCARVCLCKEGGGGGGLVVIVICMCVCGSLCIGSLCSVIVKLCCMFSRVICKANFMLLSVLWVLHTF